MLQVRPSRLFPDIFKVNLVLMKGAEVKVCMQGHGRFYLCPDLKGPTLSASKRVVQFLDRFTHLNCWDINAVPVKRWLFFFFFLNRWILSPKAVVKKSQCADPLPGNQQTNTFWDRGGRANLGEESKGRMTTAGNLHCKDAWEPSH